MSVIETSQDDKYTTDKLKKIKKEIEKKDSHHHKKILEIIVKHNINFSENNNGVFLSSSK